MYLNPNENYWVLDIESDSLTPTVIYCVCVRNVVTEEELTFYDAKTFNEFLEYNPRIFIGHNIISFDWPALIRLWGISSPIHNVIDTLVLSYLYNPALLGGHSLDAWGLRLKDEKIDFSDWSKLTPEMVEYCRQDVRLTCKVYLALVNRMISLGFSEKSCEIEHHIRIVIDEQHNHGFWFDEVRARDFLRELRLKQSNLTEEIQKLFPPKRTLVKSSIIKRTKEGRPHAQLDKDVNKYAEVIINEDDTYECYDYEEFNLASPKQRVDRLLELGWEPTKFTKKGFPQADEEALIRFSEESSNPEVKALSEVLVLQGRSSMIETWLNNLGSDSRIHGQIMTCGATTRRMIHSKPNTANIPSGAKARYGHECRSFWGVEPGRGLCLVGYDAAGLETAGLCHYLNNSKATEALLRDKPDDIHTANARRLTEALGRAVDREWGAKTSWYAWLYGAGHRKLGSIVKGSVQDGEVIVDTFFRNVPGLKELINDIQSEWKTSSGRLVTIDGGFVNCPSVSAALNYKIQSAGAIVMKLAAILLRQEIKNHGLNAKKVGDIHDEGQLECPREEADCLGNLAVDCIRNAGVILGFNVPLGGDYKIGLTWAETH